MKKQNKKADSTTGLILLFVVGIIILSGLLLFLGAFYTVHAGERAVILTFGEANLNSQGEGLHFKIPLVQTVKKMEVRVQKVEAVSDSASKDLQDVETTIALNYHVMPSEVPILYQKIGLDYRERIINPAIEESVKAVTAQFTAEELITRRPEVKRGIQDALKDRLSKSFIVVDDLNIVNFQFSEAFDNAIEAKQVAEQDVLRAWQELETVKIEAEKKVARAQAEADSIRLQSEQIKNNRDILELRAIEKWDGKLPVFTGGGAVPFIDVNNFGSTPI